MKLTHPWPWRGSAISRVLGAAFYSAKARSEESLYRRISGIGDPNTSMVPLLYQWIQEGRETKITELQGIIKQLRKYRRYTHALQVQEWMTYQMNYKLTSGGIAVRLDLISKAHDLDKAEEYFNSIPSSSRVDKVYGAMLNCYAEKRALKKADDLFKKMEELGFAKTTLTYNVMLSLYSRMENYDKLDILIQDMKENGITMDSYTLNIQLNAYANTDVEKMEKLLTEAEVDDQVKVDFHGYFTAVKGYLKAGLSEKALTAIRKADGLISSKGNRIHYEHLLTLYAAVGRKDEVYHVWDLYKNMGRVFNTGYLSVLSSLLKLEDLDGAEKIFEEWDSGTTSYDGRIANLFISTYCKIGLLEKALACVERFTSRGHNLDSGIWQCVATQCCVDGQMSKAVEMMKKAILTSGPKSRLNIFTLAACIEYLKREGNKETAHEILVFLRESGSFSSDVCDRLGDFVDSDKDYGALAAMEVRSGREEKNGVAVDGKMDDKT